MSQEETTMATTVSNMVSEAKQRVENLTVDQVSQELERGEALVVDLREPEERTQQGVIPGAVFAPRGMLEFWADPTSPYHRAEFDPNMLEFWADPTSPYHRAEFDPNRRIILHCASGGRSALAADMLRELGYTNVAHLDGGLKAWKEAGHSVEGVQS
jgi:rhodanese-related sulfurtransferase